MNLPGPAIHHPRCRASPVVIAHQNPEAGKASPVGNPAAGHRRGNEAVGQAGRRIVLLRYLNSYYRVIVPNGVEKHVGIKSQPSAFSDFHLLFSSAVLCGCVPVSDIVPLAPALKPRFYDSFIVLFAVPSHLFLTILPPAVVLLLEISFLPDFISISSFRILALHFSAALEILNGLFNLIVDYTPYR